MTKAAFLSARNDALANIAIIAAGVATLLTRSRWPDIMIGLGVAAMDVDAEGGAGRTQDDQIGRGRDTLMVHASA